MYEYAYAIQPTYISKYVRKRKSSRYATLKTNNPYGDNQKTKKQQNLNKGFKQNINLSKTSIKKIINACQWLEFIAKRKTYKTKNGKTIKYKIQFITLTLSSKQIHTDGEIVKECLGNFLNECRNNYEMNNYIWRAERQKNGNIHFHIITDCGLNYWRLLRIWNRAQNKLGYIDRFKEENPNSEYANSVDTKKIFNTGKVERYVTKYLTKPSIKDTEESKIENEFKKLNCRNYSMSYSLSRFKEFRKEVNELANLTYQHARLVSKEVNKEFCSYIPIDINRIAGLWKFITNEIKRYLEMICELKPSKLLSTWDLSEKQYKLYLHA